MAGSFIELALRLQRQRKEKKKETKGKIENEQKKEEVVPFMFNSVWFTFMFSLLA